MTENEDTHSIERQQLVCFFYLLTRGTPDSPGMSWGDVKGLIRQVGSPPRVNYYTSPGGEAMANELLDELLTGVRPGDPLDGVSDEELAPKAVTRFLEQPGAQLVSVGRELGDPPAQG